MDVLKIGSRFISRIIERSIEKTIRKKYGIEVSVQFDDIDLAYDGDLAKLHIDANAEIKKDDLQKLLKDL